MILSLIILVPFCLIALWIFIRFSPKEHGSVVVYNIANILLAIVVCAIYSYRTYAAMINGSDSAWWPILAVLGSLLILPIVLLIGALIRNFAVYRRK